jgi:AhpD family alkylhydroperoxidase
MEEKKSMDIQQLLNAMTAEMGRSPETMVLLSQVNENAVFEHVANRNFAMSGEHIPPKYKILMSLVAAAAMGAKKCINTYTQAALKNGISKEEIVEALILTRFVKASSVMSSATDALRMVVNSGK